MGNFPERALNVAVGRIPQTNYLTATTAAANKFVREELKARSLPNVEQGAKDNAEYTTGYGFPTESWVETLANGWPWAMDLSAENVGRYLLASMGAVSTSQPDADDFPSVKEHLFTPLPFLTSSQLPAYSLLVDLLGSANGLSRKVPSMIARTFGINSSGTAKLDGSVAWVGSGEEVIPHGVTWASHVNEIQGTQNFFFSKQAELTTAAASDGSTGLVNEKCELKKASFMVNNVLADADFGCPRFYGDDPNKGAIRSHHLLLTQSYDLNFTIKMRADNPHHTAMINQTPYRIVLKWIGGTIADEYKYELRITSYLSKYRVVNHGFEDGMLVMEIQPTQLFNVSANKIVEVLLRNAVTSYTS